MVLVARENVATKALAGAFLARSAPPSPPPSTGYHPPPRPHHTPHPLPVMPSVTDRASRDTQTTPPLPATSILAERDLTPSEVKVEKMGKARGKSVVKTVTMYQPPNHQPKLFDRNITIIED